MLRHSFHPLVLTIFGLAVLGLGFRLFTEPGSLITQILVTVGIMAILIMVFKSFILPRIMGNQSFNQQQGVPSQKSQRKRTVSFQSKKNEKKKRVSRPLVKRQSNVKLTVIEGKKNKNKKKNRALF